MTMEIPERLIRLIRRETSRPAPPPVRVLARALLARYGDAALAILFYGSCFRKGDDAGGIVDLYLIVDSYPHAFRRSSHAFLNRLLPPNVFYLEVPYEGRVTRAKYAVFSMKDLRRGVSTDWFHSYLWGRLAQPAGIVYARNARTAAAVHRALARAVVTFVSRVLPVMPPRFRGIELWRKGLALSYGAELRSERGDRIDELIGADPDRYAAAARFAMRAVPSPVAAAGGASGTWYRTTIPASRRMAGRIAWRVRSIQGKLLSVLRLVKGLFTFRNGLDYILWKIERHSGIRVRVDPRLRRLPLVGTGLLFWRLYRRGAFR